MEPADACTVAWVSALLTGIPESNRRWPSIFVPTTGKVTAGNASGIKDSDNQIGLATLYADEII